MRKTTRLYAAVLVLQAVWAAPAISTELLYASFTPGTLQIGKGIQTIDLSGSPIHSMAQWGDSIAVSNTQDLYLSGYGAHDEVIRYPAGGGYGHEYFPTLLPGDVAVGAYGIAIGPDGLLYMADYSVGRGGKNRIERFTVGGTSLGVFAANQATYAHSLAFDQVGVLYAMSEDRIEKFDALGALIGTYPILARDLVFDSLGDFYVVDYSRYISQYSPSANLIKQIDLGYGYEGLSIAIDSHDTLYVGVARGSAPVILRLKTGSTQLEDWFIPENLTQVSDLAMFNSTPEPSTFLMASCALFSLSPRLRPYAAVARQRSAFRQIPLTSCPRVRL